MPKLPDAFNTRFPLESFDPRYKQIWLRAALGEIKLGFPDDKAAMTFQMRLHMYRSKLRKSGDPTATSLYRAKTSRRDNILFIRPADTDFEDALSQFSDPMFVPLVQPLAADPASTTPAPPVIISLDDLFNDFNTTKDDTTS